MSEKIRGGLFNILGDITDLTVLDCYAGTGGISYEVISRGAKSSIAVESNMKAQQSIVKNIAKLKLGSRIKLISSTVSNFANNNTEGTYDLVICDPPFDQPIDVDTIQTLETKVKDGGLLILSLPVNSIGFDFKTLIEIKDKIYGEARLVFFRQKI
jgi:16S rRNA (guanine966-N2)-methyltransferase